MQHISFYFSSILINLTKKVLYFIIKRRINVNLLGLKRNFNSENVQTNTNNNIFNYIIKNKIVSISAIKVTTQVKNTN